MDTNEYKQYNEYPINIQEYPSISIHLLDTYKILNTE